MRDTKDAPMACSIMIVDDDTALLQGITVLLAQAGYAARAIATGEQAIELLSTAPPPDLIILDVLMPGIDGLEVCRHIRRMPEHIPVLILSARDQVHDRVLGLEVGADDYLTKPFDPGELLARVAALLRFKQRVAGSSQPGPAKPEPLLECGNVRMWPARHHLEIGGQAVELPPREWALLELLLRHPGQVFGRAMLLQRVWGDDFDGDDHTVTAHIQRLRARFAEGRVEDLIETVRGFGYRLRVPN